MKTTMFIVAMMFIWLIAGIYIHDLMFSVACLIAMVGWAIVLYYEREIKRISKNL
jgi:hypothetical protein